MYYNLGKGGLTYCMLDNVNVYVVVLYKPRTRIAVLRVLYSRCFR